ncbi:hypothetical protein [Nostoc sp.]|uniref:hypothetical protein n=1 Tax=Nostoc sp. TaxID=1180 RepID=UPI002FF658E7
MLRQRPSPRHFRLSWLAQLPSESITPRDIFLVVLAQRLVEKADPQIEVNFLRQLKITLPDCYEQVCKRWSEFQPSLIP